MQKTAIVLILIGNLIILVAGIDIGIQMTNPNKDLYKLGVRDGQGMFANLWGNVQNDKPAIATEAIIQPEKTVIDDDTRYALMKKGDMVIVDLYSDHSGIFRMGIESKISPDKILVHNHRNEMIFIKFSQIVPESN